MLKLKVNTGTRDGYIDLCYGKYGQDNYNQVRKVEFLAYNASKHVLYEVYDWIEAHTVKTLAVLTSTGKTKVILVEDDFFDSLKVAVDEIQAKYDSKVAWF